ncbi:MAG: hypothetical protein AAF610_09165 [Pseudomonadota bacterium]
MSPLAARAMIRGAANTATNKRYRDRLVYYRGTLNTGKTRTVIAFFQTVGLIVACALAYWSFRRRSLSLGEEPTLPEYFTRQRMYWFGLATYLLVISFLFLALVNVWMPVGPLIDALRSGFADGNINEALRRLDGGLVAPWIAAGVFLVLVGVESRFNPLLIVRDAVLDVFAMPRKAVDVYNALRASRMSQIDLATREEVISYLIADTLDVGDFDKTRESIEYKWARASLLYAKIQSYARDESYQRFFTEPSLRWGDICLLVNESSEQLAVWKSQPPHYSKTMRVITDLNDLDRLLCRLLACLIIFGSPNERRMWETVRQLGGNPQRLKLKHTYKYLLTYAAALAVGVIVGRELAVLLQRAVDPETVLSHFSFDTFRWILYGLFIYVMPVALVFISRIIADRTVTSEPERRYYGFYTLMLLLGFVVSTTMSALVLGLAGTVGDASSFDFFQSVRFSNRWGILPALLCGYAAFQMDTPASDDETKSQMILLALIRFAAWSVVALIIMLYATDGLKTGAPTLRFNVIVTTVFVAGAMGAVTRFKTVNELESTTDAPASAA